MSLTDQTYLVTLLIYTLVAFAAIAGILWWKVVQAERRIAAMHRHLCVISEAVLKVLRCQMEATKDGAD